MSLLRSAFLVALVSAVACDATRRTPAATEPAPPPAEFLVATRDSTYWVRATASGLRVRGAPLLLARYDGRFYEIFVADDDHSYRDALLVGEWLYRRDLLSGDSAVVFRDTVVPRLARAYARAHPLDTPLDPDDEGSDDPETQATAEVDVLGLYGPYLSYEYRVDTQLPSGSWHTVRHGVIDLRIGRSVRVADLLADSAGARVEREGREAYRAVLDSIAHDARAGDERAALARDVLRATRFDPTSFALVDVDGAPALEFAIPYRGADEDADALTLPPVPAMSIHSWSDVRPLLPRPDTTSVGAERWSCAGGAGGAGGGYDVVARYDSARDVVRLALADGARREWPIAAVTPPVQQIYWLDHPAVDSTTRRGLARAFDEASLYDEGTRSVDDRAPRAARGPRVAAVRYAPAPFSSPPLTRSR